MVKQEVKALEGFEEIVDKLNAKKANIEAEKAVAIEKAIAEVEARFAETVETIDAALKELTNVVEIEVPDPEEVVDEVVEVSTEEEPEIGGISF